MRLITVTVNTKAKTEKIVDMGNFEYKAFIHAPAVEGRANKALIHLLADYFDISPRNIQIKSGIRSRLKIIEIW